MEEQEYWTIHDFYTTLAKYFDTDLDDTEYREHGVSPTDIHKTKKEHKEAIRLITKVLEEESELDITELESWAEDYDDYSKWAGRYGKRELDNPVRK